MVMFTDGYARSSPHHRSPFLVLSQRAET
jgi:hypothetical protein